MAQVDQQLRRDSGMPLAYYEILVHLSDAPGRCMRNKDLAKISSFSRSRMSYAAIALEKAGWVRRTPAAEDRRGSVCALTEAGFEALVAAAPGHVAAVREKLFDVLTPQQLEELRDISRAIHATLPR